MFSGQYSLKKTTVEYQDHEGLNEEEKMKTVDYQDGIKPQSFKTFFGKGHPEFKTGKQQDALEYFNYLLDKISKGQHTAGRENPLTVFDFEL